MRSQYKILFYVKKSAVKNNGKSTIMGRITLNGKSVQFSTKQEVYIKAWSTQAGKVIKTTKTPKAEADLINKNLDTIRMRINGYYWELYEKGDDIDAESLRNLLLGITQMQQTLLIMFDDFNKDLKESVGITICKCTYLRYVRTRNLLAEFLKKKYNLSDISIRKVSLSFIKDFETFLRVERQLGTNMVSKYLQYVKKIVRLAFDSGLIRTFPFSNYKLKREKPHIGFLTEQELLSMMNKKIGIERLEKIRDVFIFSCFTGLAYAEVSRLKKEQIGTFFDGREWILTDRSKTDNLVNVPQFKIPQLIIKKYEGRLKDNRVLPVISNQNTNGYLKELAAMCGINKNLKFHMARHTFATTITLTNGIPLETVSALLGHQDLRSTQIYAEVTGQKIINDLPKLNGKLNQLEQAFGV